MKTVKIGNKEYIFIDLPKNAHDVHYLKDKKGIGYFLNSNIETIDILFESEINLIVETNYITGEIAQGVVENIFYAKGWSKTEHTVEFKNYYGGNSFQNAIESFYSLMKTNGLDIRNNYLLIEKL